MDSQPGTQVQKYRLVGLVGIAAGLLLVGWLLNTPPGLLGKADALGYAVCHRIAERSFLVGGRPLPLCARCSGMYLGAVLGLAYQAIFFPRRSGTPRWYVLAFMGLAVAAFGFDGVNSYLHLIKIETGLYEPQNLLRLITGTGMGLTISIGIFLAFNQTAWADWDQRPALDSWKHLGGFILLAAGLDLLVLSGSSLVLYPLAIISALGVIILLTLLYSMVAVMAIRKENTYRRLREMILPLLMGFVIGLVQVAAFDYIRFLLTHTWSGFVIG